jgi:predicted flap endonuclease-1-like 5' DNA nuclease
VGIDPVQAGKLRQAGVRSTQELRKSAGNDVERKQLAATTGIPHWQILGWADQADLIRVPGIRSWYAYLLQKAGVITVDELAGRDVAELQAALREANGKYQLVRRLPGDAQVVGWIKQAKKLRGRQKD